jgi:hypothetical protein
MKSIKSEVIRLIQMLPDDCKFDAIRYMVDLHEGVLKGMKDAEEGRVVSLEEADREMDEWLESYGAKPENNGAKSASTSSRKGTRKGRRRSTRKSVRRSAASR